MGKFKEWFRSWFAPIVIKSERVYHVKTEHDVKANSRVWKHFDAAFEEMDKAFDELRKAKP